MILDSFLTFAPPSNPFQVPLAAGTTVVGPGSGNIQQVDLGLGLQTTSNPSGVGIPGVASGGGARDIGVGDDPSMKLLVEIIGAFTSAGTTTAQIQILGAPDNGSGAPGTFTVMASGPTITTVSAGTPQGGGLAGAHLCDLDVPRQVDGIAMPRYLEVQIITTGTLTGSPTIAAHIVLDRFDQPWSAAGFISGYVPGITIPN